MINSCIDVDEHKVLPDGRCSNCGAGLRLLEDEWIVVKNRLLKIHLENGSVRIKCPGCKQFLTFVSIN